MKILTIIATIVIAIMAYAGGRALFSVTQSERTVRPTQQAIDNTFKRSFIRGCTSEGVSVEDCTCAYNELAKIYPDLTSNYDRMDRINKEGLNNAEIDAILECV